MSWEQEAQSSDSMSLYFPVSFLLTSITSLMNAGDVISPLGACPKPQALFPLQCTEISVHSFFWSSSFMIIALDYY